MHDPVVLSFAKKHPDHRRDLVALGDDDRHLMAHAGIAGVDRLPRLPHLGLAVAVTHMRQDIHRRVGKEVDVVGAARERALDVAGVEDLEEFSTR